jgi:hypothetical protein
MAGETSPRNMIDLQKAFGMVDPNTSRNNGLRDLLWQMGLCAGWNPTYVVSSCDFATPVGTSSTSPWTESASGTFDATSAAVDNRVATNVLVLTATAACDDSQYVENRYINGGAKPNYNPDTGQYGQNWEDTDYVGFWLSALAASGFDTAGEMKFALVNADKAGVETVGTKINLPAAVNAVHQRVELDISGETRDNVVGIRFYCSQLTAAQGIEVDSIIRYKFGNGKGPVQGPCAMITIASGQSIARGDIAQINAAQVAGITCQQEAAVAVNTNGICVVGGTGVAAGTVKAILQIGGFAYLRANAATVAGEGLIWQSDDATYGHMVEGVSTGVDEQALAKCLEAAGGQYDDIAAFIGQAVTFIS